MQKESITYEDVESISQKVLSVEKPDGETCNLAAVLNQNSKARNNYATIF